MKSPNPGEALRAMNLRDEELARQHGLEGFRMQFRDLDQEAIEEVGTFLLEQSDGIVSYTTNHLELDLANTSPRIIFGTRKTLDRDRGIKPVTNRERIEAEYTGISTAPVLTKHQKLMHDFISGHYNPKTKTIFVDATRNPDDNAARFRVVCHELSHLKDHIDGEEYASSPFARVAEMLGQNSVLGVIANSAEYLTRKGERRARANEKTGEKLYFSK